jgi:hypothetical protein
MIYLSPLPTDPETLRQQIIALEGRRERKRALGRLSAEEARQIAGELRELRSAYALATTPKEAA